MPRPYRLGRRAEQQAETRRRIIAVALSMYRERGFAATSMRAVAAAADVAPATVRNHFPTPVALAIAAGEHVLDELRPPDPSLLDDLATTPDRVERAARELAAFFDRGESWWSLIQGDAELAQAWASVTTIYDAAFARLLRAALGPLSSDPVAMTVTAIAVGPTLRYALQGAGVPAAEALEAQLGVILPWLGGRSATSAAPPQEAAVPLADRGPRPASR